MYMSTASLPWIHISSSDNDIVSNNLAHHNDLLTYCSARFTLEYWFNGLNATIKMVTFTFVTTTTTHTT